MRTLKELAKEAIDVQDACNLSGVIHAWSRSIGELRGLCPELGTEGINTHPINQLFASKVSDLARMWKDEAYPEAYTKCKELAGLNTPKEKSC